MWLFHFILRDNSGENDEETRQNIIYVRFRFEPLYKEISMEATRFIMLVFKRAPRYDLTFSFFYQKLLRDFIVLQ